MKRIEVDEFTFETLLCVLEKGQSMQYDIENYLRPYSISHGRFSILLTLYKHLDEWVNLSYLAKVLNKKRPTITGMIKKLLLDGMILESADAQDGRKKAVKLGRKGYKLLEKTVPNYNKRIIEIGHKLTIEEKKILQKLVKKINI